MEYKLDKNSKRAFVSKRHRHNSTSLQSLNLKAKTVIQDALIIRFKITFIKCDLSNLLHGDRKRFFLFHTKKKKGKKLLDIKVLKVKIFMIY